MLVWLYRGTLGHFMGGQCRYAPTCSEYMLILQARWRGGWMGLKRIGPWRGGWMGLRRIVPLQPVGRPLDPTSEKRRPGV